LPAGSRAAYNTTPIITAGKMPELMAGRGERGRQRTVLWLGCAGTSRPSREVGMFYLDRDADLNTPQEG
jgi:hypothetical protein